MKTYAILDKKTGMIVQCERHEWSQWFGKIEHRQIGLDWNGAYKVSTVFLGLNHAFDPDGPPEWFETMVFGPEEEKELFGRKRMTIGEELECWRCSTLEEAKAQHQNGVEWLANYLRQRQ